MIKQLLFLTSCILFTYSCRSPTTETPSLNRMIPDQKSVQFALVGNGIYGDQNYKLDLIPGGQYTLRVRLPDQRTYQAQTTIPEEVSIAIPDSIGMKIKYKPYKDGTPYEESIARYPIIFPYPRQEFLTVDQWNSSVDRDLLVLEPGEKFKFHDRSPYLRNGFYGISMTANATDTLSLYWGQDLNKPKEEVWQEAKYWLRFSFFNDGIGGKFHPMTEFFSLNGEEYDPVLFDPLVDNLRRRDTTYLFDVSTLNKLGTDTKPLPDDSLDAIGFFGGYFSIYQPTTVYPIRIFDLDSVLTESNNTNQNKQQ